MSIANPMARLPVAVLAGYVLGCINAGYYVVRLLRASDLRDLGSGNAGGTNAARVLGRWAFLGVGFVDAAKGVVAMWLATRLGVTGVSLGLVMVAVIVGHVLPVQLGFRGGKGVAASIGVLLPYDPTLLVVLFALIAAGVLVSRRRVLGGMVAYGSLPGVALLLGRGWDVAASVGMVAAAVIAAHWGRSGPRAEGEERA